MLFIVLVVIKISVTPEFWVQVVIGGLAMELGTTRLGHHLVFVLGYHCV